jgi:cell division protein FtsB
VVGGIGMIAFLYYRPVRSYLEAKHALAQRAAEVQALRAQHARLQRRLAASDSGLALVREARRLGLVKPGERLFIVTGISAWRRAQRHR